MHYKKDEFGKLEGMVSTCVDDIYIAGYLCFVKIITEKVSEVLDVLKVEDGKFRYTGIDIKKVGDGIEISMNEYAESLEEINLRNTRPDTAIYALQSAKKRKKATLKDLREVNGILKKVHEKESV